ncbi:MAG: chlorite dismutase family protein [Actinomycetota bacterium]|nr:chlorite dismutase family protein [Actinomycetota bacterium]
MTAAEQAAEPSLAPTTGLGVVHLFCRARSTFDPAAILDAEEAARKAGDQVVAASILGHKADMALMVLGPDLWRLRGFQSAVTAAGLEVVSSYVSLTEVSEYAAGLPDALKQIRLYPQLPPAGKPAFCFYPMSKRRGDVHNWYSLDYDERLALMVAHGRIGRTFHGRVLQLITGSTGLDDFEWGVTLFAVHPDDLKECVYQMRFDEASALYAEFGPFYTGMVADLETVIGWSLR